jgi:protein gp37
VSGKTKIEWATDTWNPVTGCSKVSPGCAHCYAETLTRRFAKAWGVPDLPWTPENASENVILHPERLDQPLRWKRPRMVFVNSMSDLFHEEISDEFIAAVFTTMAVASTCC